MRVDSTHSAGHTMPQKKIVLVSRGIVHPPLAGRRALRTLLRRARYVTQELSSIERLTRPGALEGCSALIVYIHGKTISDGALSAVDAFVRAGGGLLGIHSATASFKQTPGWFDILGARFTGHGPVARLRIEPAGAPGAGGEVPFPETQAFEVRDELYLHDHAPGIRVHFFCRHGGADVPVVWSLRRGAGRVCCATLGHRAATMRDDAWQALLSEGLAWVSG